MRRANWLSRLAMGTMIGGAVLLSGCTSMSLEDLGPPTEITPKLAREIKTKGFTEEAPILVRVFKEESELEVWKQKPSGQYALLKTYPICRWSGKLGRKTKSGDRQAPEGFYHVSMGSLNPKSRYYLSFNLGYPNRLEAALGYSGEALMIHGACSSSGCYAMTDQGISEIYAIALKALQNGQDRFQVQSYPFRMTPKNLTEHAGDPNMSFWRNLKVGYDAFERTRQAPKVSYCGGAYVFNKNFTNGEPDDPLAACPAEIGNVDNQLMTSAISTDKTYSYASAYVDGGMHPQFRSMLRRVGPKKMAAQVSVIKYPISRPEAALSDPFKD